MNNLMRNIEKCILEKVLAGLRLEKARREFSEPDYIYDFDDVAKSLIYQIEILEEVVREEENAFEKLVEKTDDEPNEVRLRTYCGASCDCETCHIGISNGATNVEDCVYCQLRWYGKGEYSQKKRGKCVKPPNV